RSGFEVTGRDGLTLTDAWADGMATLHGMFVHGFPNMFIVGIIQGSFLASNITSNYPPQGVTLAALLNHMSQTGASRVETSREAQDSWVELLLTAPPTIVGGPDCTPGYYNSEGQVEGRKERLNLGRYPAGPMAFFDHIDRWRSSGSFEGLIFDGQTIGG
ncbi:MAG: monooxygenase, partial [Microthrixaceae bacterium]|nr:monooxygenase [Microthrixaceae bacterium]